MIFPRHSTAAQSFIIPGMAGTVDPADVRKAVLEEKLGLNDPKIVDLRKRLFGFWEMNWVGFNHARDFALPTKLASICPILCIPTPIR